MTFERIGDGVRAELARFGPAHATARIVEEWPNAVGPAVARNAWPARLARDGTLHVATSSSAWAFELAQLGPTILDRLRGALGEEAPTALRFAPGPIPAPARVDESGPGAPRASPGAEEVARAASLAVTIENGELREIVAKAAAAGFARRRVDRRF